MIIREHREDFFLNEPGRFAVRDLLKRLRQCHANAPHAFDLFLALIRFPFVHTRQNGAQPADVNDLTSAASSDNLIILSNLKPILPSNFAEASLSGEVIARIRPRRSRSRAYVITAAADSTA